MRREAESGVKNEGFGYVRSLFDKTKLGEDDFTRAYDNDVDETLLEGITALVSKKDTTPKDGIVSEFMTKMKVGPCELYHNPYGDDRESLMIGSL